MSGWQLRGRGALAVAALMTMTAGASAQTAAYKCVSRGTVLYSQVPCPGARQVADTPQRATGSKWKQPPQDRAKIARRALLAPEDRQECAALDGRMQEQETMLKTLGEAVTIQDEMPLVQSKKRFRKLRC